jgi:hypothetical protein
MLIHVNIVQVCDATDDDSSNADHKTYTIQTELFDKNILEHVKTLTIVLHTSDILPLITSYSLLQTFPSVYSS